MFIVESALVHAFIWLTSSKVTACLHPKNTQNWEGWECWKFCLPKTAEVHAISFFYQLLDATLTFAIIHNTIVVILANRSATHVRILQNKKA